MEQAFAGVDDMQVAVLAGGAAVATFFSPTIVAIARGRGAGAPTFLLNLLGWTIIGWLVAWLIAFRDYRRCIHVSIPVWPTAGDADRGPHPLVSEDALYWWDGSVWRAGAEQVPSREWLTSCLP
jgi:hypothetical protein